MTLNQLQLQNRPGKSLLSQNYVLIISYLPTPPLEQDMTQDQFFSGVQQVWIQSFPSPRLVASLRLSYYLPIAGGRIFGFIPFPRVLVLCEMQSVRSRIWTRVAVSISWNDNHYSTGTSIDNHYINGRWNVPFKEEHNFIVGCKWTL